MFQLADQTVTSLHRLLSFPCNFILLLDSNTSVVDQDFYEDHRRGNTIALDAPLPAQPQQQPPRQQPQPSLTLPSSVPQASTHVTSISPHHFTQPTSSNNNTTTTNNNSNNNGHNHPVSTNNSGENSQGSNHGHSQPIPALQIEDYLATKMKLAQIMRDFNEKRICFVGLDGSKLYVQQYQTISSRVKGGEDIQNFLRGKLVMFVTAVDKKKRSITETKLFIPDFELHN
jgi:hypothetical protein